MAGAGKGAEVPEKEAAKGGKGKLLIIVAAALVLAGGGGAAAWFLGLFGGHGEAAAAAHAPAQAAGHDPHAAEPEPPPIAFVDLPDLLVNLKSTGKRPRFLKLKVALEAKDPRTAEQVKRLTPRIMDGFQLYLRALDADEIQGSNGMLTLKEELLARINQAIAPSRINDVLFKEILVQ
jgi:flagellar FliL protein